MEQSKKCTYCGKVKNISEFYRNKATKDGFMHRCKPCKYLIDKEYRAKNIEKLTVYMKNRYEEKREELNLLSKKYYRENLEKARLYAIKWRKENPERFKEYGVKWREENKDKIKQYAEINRQKNKENKKLWEKENRAARKAIVARRRSRKLKNGIYKISEKQLNKLLSSVCYICGETKTQHLDHIIPISKGGSHSIGNLAPACQQCNLKKGSKFLIQIKLQNKLNKERNDEL